MGYPNFAGCQSAMVTIFIDLDKCGVSSSLFVAVLQQLSSLPPTSARNHLQLGPGEKEKVVMGQRQTQLSKWLH
jgi:hypothetical protein